MKLRREKRTVTDILFSSDRTRGKFVFIAIARNRVRSRGEQGDVVREKTANCVQEEGDAMAQSAPAQKSKPRGQEIMKKGSNRKKVRKNWCPREGGAGNPPPR